MKRTFIVFALTTITSLFVLAYVSADSLTITFEPTTYHVGTINSQDGWSSLGAAGSGCAVYDHAVVANGTDGAPSSFQTQSLRISNAVTSGCFSDQTFSKSLANEAGESTATNGGFSGGTRQNYFEYEVSFASAVPEAEQPGLSVVLSADRGDGARMTWTQIADTPEGLQVNFYDYRNHDFQFTNIANGLDRVAAHTLKVTIQLIPGPANDRVKVYVDGVLRYFGTTWEDYFRDWEDGNTRTVDSVLFRTGGAAAPATAGKGLLFDNLSTLSALAPSTQEECMNGGWQTFTYPRVFKNQGQCVASVVSNSANH